MNIYVGNLSDEVTEDELRTEFAAFGQVSAVNIMRDRRTGHSRGFGFVEMPVVAEGQAAVAGLKDKQLKERTLDVNEARPPGGGFGGGRKGGGFGGGHKGGSRGGKKGGFRGGGGGQRRY
jgi:RNA recognition motif-containing protein